MAKYKSLGRREMRAYLETTHVWTRGNPGKPRVDPAGGQMMRVDRPVLARIVNAKLKGRQ